MICGRPTMLITDDDRAVRESLARVFGRYGMDTCVAADGEEAIRIATNREVHLVLMDLHMPRISGLEAIERLRERAEGLPCILITGAVTDEVVARAEEINVFSVIAKPLNIAELVKTVQRALEQSYRWQPTVP